MGPLDLGFGLLGLRCGRMSPAAGVVRAVACRAGGTRRRLGELGAVVVVPLLIVVVISLVFLNDLFLVIAPVPVLYMMLVLAP